MEYTVWSLRKLCIYSVSELLLKCHEKVSVPPLDNPFSAFDPRILHEIIACVSNTAKDDDECFKCSYVYPLTTTGRITSFELTFAHILQEEAEEIFDSLQSCVKKLITLKLSYKHLREDPHSFLRSSNLGTLLHSAKNLLSLNTSINFNLSELCHCESLEKLTLNFFITDRLSFSRVSDKISYNHPLKILRILNIKENKGLHLDIAEILQYCVEIIEIDYDVSKSLVHLHKNKKATKYKLQKTLLGNDLYPRKVSRRVIQIASMYCPDLITVEASPADYPAFRALRNFRNITNLTLNDPGDQRDNFNRAVRPLLENSDFGPNLTHLTLRFFSRLDFSCIGACCPVLEELTVEYLSENNQSEFTANSFKNLISLYVKNIMGIPCRADSIIALLSKTKTLDFLTIEVASSFNDIVLDIIMENTKVFSKVRTLTIKNGRLTIPGLEMFAQSMTSLISCSYTSELISSEDIEIIFRRYRPHVEMFRVKDDDEGEDGDDEGEDGEGGGEDEEGGGEDGEGGGEDGEGGGEDGGEGEDEGEGEDDGEDLEDEDLEDDLEYDDLEDDLEDEDLEDEDDGEDEDDYDED